MSTRVEVTGVRFPDTTTLATNPIPSGTTTIFRQAAAPVGWTRVTAGINDMALRITTGGLADRTTGIAFSTAFASRTPTGTVSVTGSTDNASPAGSIVSAVTGVSISAGTTGSTIATGSVSLSGTVGSSNIDGNRGVTGGTAPTGSTNSVSVSGSTASSSVGLGVHDHGGVIVGGTSTAFGSDPFGSPVSVITSLTSGNTSSAGTSTDHSHTISTGSHDHTISITSHTHDIFLSGTGHTHTFSGSGTFSGNGHTHSFSGGITDSGHSHTFTGGAHNHGLSGMGATFNGSAMDFSVNYIDVIIATRN